MLQLHPGSRILIASQAPGSRAHQSGIPFADASGNRLRDWLGVDRETFYNPEKIAILPMGFCYPGKGKSGDLPPRPECADTWRERLLAQLESVALTLVIGRYALDYHFAKPAASVTEQVMAWQAFWPRMIPLPHPSPRNNRWLLQNPWFEAEILPRLRQRVAEVLAEGTIERRPGKADRTPTALPENS